MVEESREDHRAVRLVLPLPSPLPEGEGTEYSFQLQSDRKSLEFASRHEIFRLRSR